jgi:hypothetical protein
MLTQQTAGQIFEFAQQKPQGFVGSGVRFNSLHKNRVHLVIEIDCVRQVLSFGQRCGEHILHFLTKFGPKS